MSLQGGNTECNRIPCRRRVLPEAVLALKTLIVDFLECVKMLADQIYVLNKADGWVRRVQSVPETSSSVLLLLALLCGTPAGNNKSC